MNMFDYRRKKDLQGRTTEFRKDTASAPPPGSRGTAPRAASARAKLEATNNTSQYSTRRRQVKNRTRDRWVYNQRLEQYRQEKVGPSAQNQPQLMAQPGETKADTDERLDKYRKLLNDWFSGELIKDVYRRHPVHILYIGRPALILFPLTLIITTAAIFVPLLFIPALIFWFIQIALTAWYINDWSNDYLIVTDRRVILLEKISFLDTAKTEIPLDKVQEVRVVQKRGTFEYIFQVGTVTITSSGRTTITFERVHKPERVRGQWDTLRKSYMRARTDFRRDRMRNYLENKIWGAPLVNWNADEEARGLNVTEDPGWLGRIFPSEPVRDRQKKQIIWHTHPWILIKRVLPLFLLLIGLIVFALIGLPLVYSLGIGLLSTIASVGSLILIFVIAFIVWYKYENWINDRYIVGEEKILDILKLPFGFDETIGTIDIRNVQDVNSEKSGIVANFLNFGTVNITTVGGPGVSFKNVPDPDIIEDEVSRRKELLRFLDEERQDRLTADFFSTYRDILLHPDDSAPSEHNDGYGQGPYNRPPR